LVQVKHNRRGARVCVAVVSLALALAASAEEGEESSYIGDAVCRGCHGVEAAHWDPTLHGRVFTLQPRSELEGRRCEACHGPGSAHLTDPQNASNMVAFTRRSATGIEVQNDMCLECHRGGARIRWSGSVHEEADVACSDCHNPMSETSQRRLMRESSVAATCLACHPAQRVEFRKRSHMPLFEGKISCEDCHNPHGSTTDPLLRGDSVNHTCYTCHPEKRGPFLWEHAPVRESCLNCHRPHGSNHDKLLTTIATTLCQTCHSQLDHPSDLLTAGNLAGGFAPDERVLNRGCVNCHAQIHGSNHPSGPRFHR
jgi:DmsE family decaheme c-type cytochrome